MSTPVTTMPPEDAICPDDATPRVLIVDDEDPVIEILTYIVADAGYVPLTASHGRRALEVARAEWPALLITDLMMPYLSGADLIAALREEAAARGVPPIPSVLISGAGIAATRAASADVTLRKPFELAEIDALLERFLGNSSATDATSLEEQ